MWGGYEDTTRAKGGFMREREVAVEWVLMTFFQMGASDDKLREERKKLDDNNYLAEWAKISGFKELQLSKTELNFRNVSSTCIVDVGDVEVVFKVENHHNEDDGIGAYEFWGSKGIDSKPITVIDSVVIDSYGDESANPDSKIQAYVEWYVNQVCVFTVDELFDDHYYDESDYDYDYDDYEGDQNG